tara:strand:+ start:595 stop:741 length:147 start_codon:yes stop_codon:yes gene_type:complete
MMAEKEPERYHEWIIWKHKQLKDSIEKVDSANKKVKKLLKKYEKGKKK